MTVEIQTAVACKVTWYDNPRQEGVMATAPDGRLIFPSGVGMPCPDERGMIRERMPEVGSLEEVVLVLAPRGSVYHAYPVLVEEVIVEEARGVVEIDGHVIVLRNSDYRVSAVRKGGQLIITIE